MGKADALIFAFAALVDLAVLAGLRWRRRRRAAPQVRIARSLCLALRRGI